MRSSARVLALALCGSTLPLANAALAAEPAPLDPERHPADSTQLPPPKMPAEEEPPLADGEAPPARAGFQIAFRTGAAIPAGSISGAQPMSDVFGVQVPLQVEIGGKLVPELFLGAYAGLAFGGVSGSFDRECKGRGFDCSSRSTRIGIEAVVYLLPSGRVSPWLGYGIGYESTTQVTEEKGSATTQSVSGIEYAHLMSGLDVRISRTVGLGPLVDVAVGQYGSLQRDASTEGPASDRDIENGALHAWISVGARVVFLP